MPSSLIFAGLVVLWLLILVPTIAHRRQEVARPSTAALSGRVLERPSHARAARRRSLEVDEVPDADRVGDVAVTHPAEDCTETAAAPREAELPPARSQGGRDDPGRSPVLDDVELRATAEAVVARWERPDAVHRVGGAGAQVGAASDAGPHRPASRYRPGRGGFDPAAAALAAKARYAFRQRVVLGLLTAAVLTAAAAYLVLPALWWVHGAVAVVLVTYLVYLRRQVRMEEAIRERRAARMAGARPSAVGEDEKQEWARREGGAAGSSRAGDEPAGADGEAGALDDRSDAVAPTGEGLGTGVRAGGMRTSDAGGSGAGASGRREDEQASADDAQPAPPGGIRGVAPGESPAAEGDGAAGLRSAAGSGDIRPGTADIRPGSGTEPGPALPRLHPVAPPSLPSGTAPLEADDLDPDLPAVDRHTAGRYRRAAGQ